MSNALLLTPPRNKGQRYGSLQTVEVSSQVRIQESIPTAGKHTLWISDDQGMTLELLKTLKWPTKRLGRAILLFKPRLELVTALCAVFDRVAFSSDGGFLSSEELGEVLGAKNREDLFIGGSVDKDSQTVNLWRGTLDSIVVPFSAFPVSGDGTAPDFDDFEVIDYGQTIRFGEYEAASDAILYEYDPKYRRRKKKERTESEQGIGASIRRLRKQRGLRREDFATVCDAKTIARIEQGKGHAIRQKTLVGIANVLEVTSDDLATY
ncbi:MAG: helix-turn-helix domain-containing protein [Pirellulales bacterium]